MGELIYGDKQIISVFTFDAVEDSLTWGTSFTDEDGKLIQLKSYRMKVIAQCSEDTPPTSPQTQYTPPHNVNKQAQAYGDYLKNKHKIYFHKILINIV